MTPHMTPHPSDLLPEYAAGILPAALAAEVQAHLTGCAACAHEVLALEEVLAQLPLALPAPPPPPELRGRLLGSLAGAGRFDRFDRFLGRIAALLDVTAARALDLVALMGDATAWQPGPVPSRVVHLTGGPRVAQANCGFVRVPAGAAFPRHRHLGTEHVLVLQGRFVDDAGRTFGPGDEDTATTASEHAFSVLSGEDLIFLVVLEKGIEILGDRADL